MSDTHSFSFQQVSGRRASAVLGILFVFFICCPNTGAATPDLSLGRLPNPLSPYGQASGNLVSQVQLGIQTGTVTQLTAGNWLTNMMNKLESWLSNRTHMIQFCAIGMVVALFVIWWRKT